MQQRAAGGRHGCHLGSVRSYQTSESVNQCVYLLREQSGQNSSRFDFKQRSLKACPHWRFRRQIGDDLSQKTATVAEKGDGRKGRQSVFGDSVDRALGFLVRVAPTTTRKWARWDD